MAESPPDPAQLAGRGSAPGRDRCADLPAGGHRLAATGSGHRYRGCRPEFRYGAQRSDVPMLVRLSADRTSASLVSILGGAGPTRHTVGPPITAKRRRLSPVSRAPSQVVEVSRADPANRTALPKVRILLCRLAVRSSWSIFLVWVTATVIGLAVAAMTKVGPVVLVVRPRHGLHLGDLVGFAVLHSAALLITLLIRSRSERRRSSAFAGDRR